MRFKETVTCKILIDHHYHLYCGFIINVFTEKGKGEHPLMCTQYFLVEPNMLNVIRQSLYVK